MCRAGTTKNLKDDGAPAGTVVPADALQGPEDDEDRQQCVPDIEVVHRES